MKLNIEKYEELKEKIKEYYLQPSLLRFFSLFSQDREVVPVMKASFYAPRPSQLEYDTDFKLKVLEGATSFHCSVEKWKKVMSLKEVGENKEKLNELRKGWDIIIDVDAKESIDDARVVCLNILDFLHDFFEIKHVSIKFSGSRGFHLGINGLSLPQEIEGIEMRKMYPELLQKISFYLREKVKERCKEEMKKVEVESNWSYRHLFRMPYSINEKTYLISKVITQDELEEFHIENMEIQEIKKPLPFILSPIRGDFEGLCYEAIDFYEKNKWKEERTKEIIKKVEIRKKGLDEIKEIMKEIEESKRELELTLQQRRSGGKKIKTKIPTEFFPNTIKNILNGLEDGKKRALFILLNFLFKMNWSWEEIEKEIWEWNKRNKEELKESYIRAQIKYFKKNEEKIKEIPPPNFETEGYYKDIGVLDRDDLKLGVKNPVSYAYKKFSMFIRKRNSDENKKGGKNENSHYRSARYR